MIELYFAEETWKMEQAVHERWHAAEVSWRERESRPEVAPLRRQVAQALIRLADRLDGGGVGNEVGGDAGRKVPDVVGGHCNAGKVVCGRGDCRGVLSAGRQIGCRGEERRITRIGNRSGDSNASNRGR